MYEYYKTLYNASEREVYERMVLAFQRGQKTVDCGNGADIKQVGQIYFAVTCDHPELFWLSSDVRMTQRGFGGLFSNEVITEHLYAAAQISQMNAAIEHTKTQLRSLLQTCKNDVEKEKVVCDHLIRTVTYQLNDTHNQNAGTALAYGRGQCSGISRAAKLLFDFAGLKSVVVTGKGIPTGKPPEAHAWNMVEIDGQWYHLDITFMIGHNPDKREPFYYDFFNQDDAEAQKNHSWDAAKYPVCDQVWDKKQFPIHFQTTESAQAFRLPQMPQMPKFTQASKDTGRKVLKDLSDLGNKIFGRKPVEGGAKQSQAKPVQRRQPIKTQPMKQPVSPVQQQQPVPQKQPAPPKGNYQAAESLFEFKELLQKALQSGETALNVRVNIRCDTATEFQTLINRACQTVVNQSGVNVEMQCAIQRQDVLLTWKKR
ncbi:MAG: transglutaminase domain-containing protein [Clostridia bacterium]|nr:transglutaminase domain-containing protein [Clostridia bacterium]